MTSLSGGNSERVPPDPISNSEVKTLCADDSVGFPRESRTLPDLYSRPLYVHSYRGFLLLIRKQNREGKYSLNEVLILLGFATEF